MTSGEMPRNTRFVSGHDFSRAVRGKNCAGFSRCKTTGAKAQFLLRSNGTATSRALIQTKLKQTELLQANLIQAKTVQQTLRGRGRTLKP